jgi:flagellar basal-body rod protein FlgC
MGIMTGIEVSASGLTVQRRRLEILMSNLVNANTTQPAGKEPYRRKDVELAATPPRANFGAAFDEAVSAVRGVAITKVVVDQNEPERRYEPGHPHADKDGFVLYPNINPMQEMVNVMSTTRAYEANLQVVNAAKDMLNKTLEIIK